jgi:GNAT superfamily N-acetyltransferase
MDIIVKPFDPSDQTAADQAYEIERVTLAADLPDFPPMGRAQFFGNLHNPWAGTRTEYAIASIDGEAAGFVRIILPVLDNLEMAEIDLQVHPSHRRRGVGRALYEFTEARVRELGRKNIACMAARTLPGGVERDSAPAAFAEALGATSALVDVRRRLDLTVRDDAALDTALAAAWEHAGGYSVVQWQMETPEQYVNDVAYLDGRLLSDAPMGDLAWEPEKIDAARIRAGEKILLARGRRRYHTGLRHDATDRLVAWTTVDLMGTVDWHAYQQITLVDPPHRGHRLGLIVKIENLRHALAHEPGLRVIDTWNAQANKHMIAINEAIGFRAVDAWDNWQISL